MRRIAKITVGGTQRVVDLLRNPPTPPGDGAGFGLSPFGASRFGGGTGGSTQASAPGTASLDTTSFSFSTTQETR